MIASDYDSPIERFESLGEELGVDLFVKRDDLLPFPLAGNKVRKIHAELESLESLPDVIITNGSVDSNHCRTLALFAARLGFRSHLVLHGASKASERALSILASLGATFDLVEPSGIRDEIEAAAKAFENMDQTTFVLAGGCHTPAGAIAYRDAALGAIAAVSPDVILLASGTGATHGGIAAGAATDSTRVIGISVARDSERGASAVREAAVWAGMPEEHPVEFIDAYREGGYAKWGASTKAAVDLGWRFGLPLDLTYTGKAFAGLAGLTRSGGISTGSRVLFWHTGGLWNALNSPLPKEDAHGA